MRKLLLLTGVLVMLISACADGSSNTPEPHVPPSDMPVGAQNPQVTIEMEDNLGKIVIELYPDIAPNTVCNFIKLINDGYYNGVIFHRVISSFMIQGGSPNGTAVGGPGYSIKGEMTLNGNEKNQLLHERGVISMARQGSQNPAQDAQYYDTAGSQFFIMVEDYPSLDGKYTAFGEVIDGMDVVDRIKETRTDDDDRPKVEKKMKKVTVNTFGAEYPDPEVIKAE